MEIDEAKLNEFLGKMIGDLGAAANRALAVVGDKLGFYKALAETRSGHFRWLHTLPPCYRDTVQSDLGSSALGNTGVGCLKTL